MRQGQAFIFQAMATQTTEGTQLAEIFTNSPEVLTDLVRGARLPWKQVARALKGTLEALLTLEHALALAAIPPMPKAAPVKSAAVALVAAPPSPGADGGAGPPAMALHLPLVAVTSGSPAPVTPPPVVPKAVAKSKPAPSATPVLAIISSNTGENLRAAARDAAGGVGAKCLADPLICTLWKAYKGLFRLITWKLPCFLVSFVLVGGLVAGICLLANPRLIAVAIMHLLRLIPDLLQYVIAEMGSEFHSQFFGTAHCPAHCRDEGYVPQGPPVGHVLPAPHPPALPPSWAPAMTFGSIMMVLLAGRHK